MESLGSAMGATAPCLGLFQNMDWSEAVLDALCHRIDIVVDPVHFWIFCDPLACVSCFWTLSCSMKRNRENCPKHLETMSRSHLDGLLDCERRSSRWCFAMVVDILGKTLQSVSSLVCSLHNAMVHWSTLLQRSWQGKLRLSNDVSSAP